MLAIRWISVFVWTATGHWAIVSGILHTAHCCFCHGLLLGYFTQNLTIASLSLGNHMIAHCQWSSPEGYGYIYHINPPRTVIIAKSNKILFIPHGLYCRILFKSLDALTPERCGSNHKHMILKLILLNCSLDTRCRISVRWMPQGLLKSYHWLK